MEVRPVLSYVLWRLHESTKGRADASFMIVLSNDPKTQAAGQKLDIEVRTMEGIRNKIASQVTGSDPDVMGDIEREFGVAGPCLKSLQNGSAHGNEHNFTLPKTMQTLPANGEVALNGHNMGDGVIHGKLNGKLEAETHKEENATTENFQSCLDGSTMVDRPTTGFLSHNAENTVESRNLPQPNYPTVIDIAEDNAVQQNGELDDWTKAPPDEFVSEKISNITAWIKNLAPKLSSSPEPSLNPQLGTESSAKDENVSNPPVVLKRADDLTTPSPRRTPNASPAPQPPAEEPEDSDEEVVVFNPKAKRLSAQQKLPLPLPPPPQSPKPTTAPLVTQSPKSIVSQSPKQNSQRNPRKATAARQHQPKAPHVVPAVIDPDAFGRSFATNPRTNNHPNSRYSPRGSPRSAAIRTPEPELDYVLKSGNTRASVRGKGKLWVP